MDEKRITKPVCSHCGSDNLEADASAAWDVDAGCWSLKDAKDATTCVECGYRTSAPGFVVWEGGARGKWIAVPGNSEILGEAALTRLNDDDAINPGFVDLSTVDDETPVTLTLDGAATWAGTFGAFWLENHLSADEIARARADLEKTGEAKFGSGAFVESVLVLTPVISG